MPDPTPEEGKSKIFIDSDWKSQAQAEKEKLAAQEKERASTAAAGAGGPGAGGDRAPPEASFDELIRLLATQALVYLGAFPDPQTGRAVVALDLAQLNVDLLGVLEEKTRGNLTEEEADTLGKTLGELRLAFADVSAAVSKAVDEGRIQRVPTSGSPGGAGSMPPGFSVPGAMPPPSAPPPSGGPPPPPGT